jgi:HK97 family phage prohead protease
MITPTSYKFAIRDSTEDGIINGYASVFDVVDSQYDVIVNGAFRHYNNNSNAQTSIKLLWQHKPEQPIGFIKSIQEDHYGLYFEAKLLLDVAKAKEAHHLVKAGIIDSVSIGYTPLDYYIDHKRGVRVIKEINLWEISLVTFPANQAAKLTRTKHKLTQQHREMLALSHAIKRCATALQTTSTKY